jgi:hypothetical protein
LNATAKARLCKPIVQASCFILSATNDKVEQHVCTKLWKKFCISTTKTLEMLHKAFGQQSLSQRAIFQRHSCLMANCQLKLAFTVTKHQQNDRKAEQMQELIHKHHHQTIYEHAVTTGISYRVGQELLMENLNVCRIAVKFIPRLWTNDQKHGHINLS